MLGILGRCSMRRTSCSSSYASQTYPPFPLRKFKTRCMRPPHPSTTMHNYQRNRVYGMRDWKSLNSTLQPSNDNSSGCKVPSSGTQQSCMWSLLWRKLGHCVYTECKGLVHWLYSCWLINIYHLDPALRTSSEMTRLVGPASPTLPTFCASILISLQDNPRSDPIFYRL